MGAKGGRRSLWISSFRILLLSLVLVLSSHDASSFYVPGVAPVEFKRGDPLVIKVLEYISIDLIFNLICEIKIHMK